MPDTSHVSCAWACVGVCVCVLVRCGTRRSWQAAKMACLCAGIKSARGIDSFSDRNICRRRSWQALEMAGLCGRRRRRRKEEEEGGGGGGVVRVSMQI
jgi:hypothetical protein